MRVLFDISAHGLGHLAQTAPVIAELKAIEPRAEIVVRSGLAREVLARRILAPFQLIPSQVDFGLVMTSSFVVDRQATVERYLRLHDGFDATVQAATDEIDAARIDVVASNVGYVALAAAARAGAPALAFSSINWRDIVRHYCGGDPRLGPVLEEIAQVYRTCGPFIRLVPGTAMSDFATIPLEGLIVARGTDRRAELRARLALPDEALVAAFSFTDGETEAAPDLSGQAPRPIAAIGPARWSGGAGWIAFADAGMPFLDLVRSADLVVAKPGYGIVTEAAAAGTPTLLIPRDDWPETQLTSHWHRENGRFEVADVALPRLTGRMLCDAHARLSARRAATDFRTDGARLVAARIARIASGRAA